MVDGILGSVDEGKIHYYSQFPHGYIHRVENNESQFYHVLNDENIRFVMINIDHAEQMLKDGKDSSFFGESKKVITTSTINDDILPKYFPEKEARIVRQFNPHHHIPSDRPVYKTQNRNERMWNIRNSVAGAVRVRELLYGTSITLIPLIKGVENEELIVSHRLLKTNGFLAVSYYCAQYFGRNRGNYSNLLISDLKNMVDILDLSYLLLIGLSSHEIVRNLPPEVVAHAGSGLIRKSCWNKEEASFGTQLTLGEVGDSPDESVTTSHPSNIPSSMDFGNGKEGI